MRNIFANISIGKKPMVLLAVFIAGYTIFGLVSFSTLNTLRIDGQLYNQIIMSKDLIVDVLPPPEYIIESYLDVLWRWRKPTPPCKAAIVKSITKPIANIASVTDTLVKNGKNVKSLLEASEVGRTGLQEVAQNIQEIASSMDEMASGSDQINTAVNHVNEISGKNREAIDHLTKEVSWFKVE